MEHRLIQGGEQFLPFARSCITKLKRLGLPYADQSYEVDGCSIKVRIEPGHEYIRIDGGATLYMDSGIIDALTAKLFWSTNVGTYNQGFAKVIQSGAYAGWSTSPDLAAGKMELKGGAKGVIKLSSIQPDGLSSRAFSSAFVPEPPEEMPKESVAAIEGKTAAAVLCPASIFTGRCRQYVQALYGSYLFNLGSSTSVKSGAPTILPGLTPGDGGIPRILVNNILIDSGSGIVEDEYGKLYLVRLVSDHNVYITPMQESRGARALRTAYKDKDPTKRKITDPATFKRISSFIMAHSTPIDSPIYTGSIVGVDGTVTNYGLDGQTKIGATPTDTNVYWMGYSWHWMYGKNIATCVALRESVTLGNAYVDTCAVSIEIKCVSTPIEGGTGYKNEWRVVEVARDDWKPWRLDRLHWCLAEPDWAKGGMIKTFPPSGNYLLNLQPVTDALIYLFYKEDDTQVRCSVTLEKVKAIADVREFEPTYAREGLAHADESLLTCGFEDGWQTDKTDGAKNIDGGTASDGSPTPENAYYWTAVFKVGELTTRTMEVRHIEVGTRIDVNNKRRASDPTPGQYARSLYTNYVFNLPQQIDVGRPNPTPFGPYPQQFFTAVAEQDFPVLMTYDVEKSVIYEEWNSTVTLVTPIGDSEAVYFQAAGRHINLRSEREVRSYSSIANSFLKASRFTRPGGTVGGQTIGNPDGSTYVIPEVYYAPYTGPWEYAERSRYPGAAYGDVQVSMANPDSIAVDEQYGVIDLLVTKSGNLPVKLPNLSNFHNEDIDEIPAIIKSFSGVTADGPILTWIEGAGSGQGSYAGSAFPILVGYT